MDTAIYTAAIVIICAYLMGSLPTAYIMGRLRKGVDIREVGTRNMGAMNVIYTVGMAEGISVLLIDVAKGAAAVFLARWLGTPLIIEFAAGAAAVMGERGSYRYWSSRFYNALGSRCWSPSIRNRPTHHPLPYLQLWLGSYLLSIRSLADISFHRIRYFLNSTITITIDKVYTQNQGDALNWRQLAPGCLSPESKGQILSPF